MPRTRTPPPPRELEAETLLPAQVTTTKANEVLQQFRYVQEFIHNPPGINLGNAALTSTSPEEALQRLTEVEYQLNVLKALQMVLQEEMEVLRQIVPGETNNPEAPHR